MTSSKKKKVRDRIGQIVIKTVWYLEKNRQTP